MERFNTHKESNVGTFKINVIMNYVDGIWTGFDILSNVDLKELESNNSNTCKLFIK